MDYNTFARELPDGSIEIVDETTGEVVEKRDSFESAYGVRESQGLTRSLHYSPHLGDIVCQRLAQGIPINKISDAPGFPSPSTIARWTMQHPSFKAKFKEARRALAFQCSDKILEVAEIDIETGQIGYISKDDAAGKKVQIDSLKWLAEKSDSEFFTTKNVKHFGDEDKPIKFIIQTGIDRSTDKVVDADCEEIEDADLPIQREDHRREQAALPATQDKCESFSKNEKGKEDSGEREGEHDNLQHETPRE